MEVGNDVQPDGYVPVICGLSRTKFPDLERAWDAVRHAKRPRVHTFIATSQIHMEHKLRMTPDQVCVGGGGCGGFGAVLGGSRAAGGRGSGSSGRRRPRGRRGRRAGALACWRPGSSRRCRPNALAPSNRPPPHHRLSSRPSPR
jgi:hypothetical protein